MIKSQIQSECINQYYLIHIQFKCRRPVADYECLPFAFSWSSLGQSKLEMMNESWKNFT